VGHRVDPQGVIWQHAPDAFAFLLQEWDFEGPERTEDGVVYHRPDLHVSVEVWAWKNETGFSTTVRAGSGVDASPHSASLGCLYVACGLGPLQDVPETAGSQYTIRKRIAQHAGALRRVMPHLNAPTVVELLRRCAGRELPDAEAVQPQPATPSATRISPRLMRRIHADFPHHTDLVVNRLHTIDPLIAQEQPSPQAAERMYAAVIRVAGGRLDRLDSALPLARLDWRDLLMAGDLGHEGWPDRLSAWLGPNEPPIVAASPGSRGLLVEADGRRWVARRRRIDLRILKRLIHRTDVVVVLGEAGGSLRRITDGERHPTWHGIRRAYAGPGGSDHAVDGAEYMGHEFVADDGTVMLYLEQRC
jgi:hypothetical protein